MRVCLTPRWAAGPHDDWYPWLRRQLRGHEVCTAELAPRAHAPTIDECVTSIQRNLSCSDIELADTVLIGHSVGCQAQLQFLARLPINVAVAGLICVAGWWSLDAPRPALADWSGSSYDPVRLRNRARKTIVLLSDNDPYTSDYRANASRWEQALGAEIRIVPGGRHFNRGREPAVLDAVRAVLR